VCDNVINFEVVLASGEVVEANANSHKDLWIALKGGLNNFGVVTRFDLPVFSQGKIWGGAVVTALDNYPATMQALHDFTVQETPDEEAHVIVALINQGGAETFGAFVYHTGGKVSAPALAAFSNMEPKYFHTIREDSLLGFTDEQANWNPSGNRVTYFTTSVQLDVKLLNDIRGLWAETCRSLESVTGLAFSIVYQPVSKGLLRHSAQRGGNSLGLKPEDGPIVIILANPVHSQASDDDLVSSAVLDLINKINALAEERGKSARYRFTNYGFKTQAILEGYGKEQLDFLHSTSKAYDPDSFFQRAVPSGFKLPNA